jgi:biopolymer transport protein ExbD
MHFFVRKRRQTPTIIIVALIDVLIVLLIFLIVTTTFKQVQPALQLTLPESTQAQRLGADENAPLLVSIDAQGGLRFGPEALPVTEERLRNELQQGVEKNPQLRVAISTDRAAPVGQFLKVRDIAIEAKVKNLLVYAKEVGQP